MFQFGLSLLTSSDNDHVVEKHRYGRVIRGVIPYDDFLALCTQWQKEGFDVVASGISSALCATFAVSRQEDVPKWEAEINQNLEKKYSGNAELIWFHGTDTGVSSATIFSVLASQDFVRDAVKAQCRFSPDVPHDSDDFGRCHRLLERFPAWRERLPEVAEAHQAWKPFIEQWPELTALYLEEFPTGRCPKLYDRIQELRASIREN